MKLVWVQTTPLWKVSVIEGWDGRMFSLDTDVRRVCTCSVTVVSGKGRLYFSKVSVPSSRRRESRTKYNVVFVRSFIYLLLVGRVRLSYRPSHIVLLVSRLFGFLDAVGHDKPFHCFHFFPLHSVSVPVSFCRTRHYASKQLRTSGVIQAE